MKSRRIAGPLFLVFLIASFGMWLQGAVPDVPTGQWLPGPALAQPRAGAVSVALDDGRVLVIGGRTADGPVDTVEVFNTNGTMSVGAQMLSPRAGHTATKLPDGGVLVVGGTTLVTTDDGSGPVSAEVVTSSAEVFHVNAGVWSPAASLSIARNGHTATAVADGHVVVAGGVGTDGAALDSFEVFDPEWGVFSSPGLLSAARTEHAAAAAGATRVLVGGGRNANGVLSTADIVDVASGTVSTLMLNAPRTGATATALLDGRILVAGGSDGVNDLASAELLDPVTGISVPTASMAQPRREHLALLLANNNTVLITGGRSAGIAVRDAEQFIPWTGELSSTGSPITSRTSAVLSSLSADGRAWLAGGRVAGGSLPSASEYYGFATIKTDKNDYSPGMTVVMTGSGWQPGEAVSLLLHEVATGHADRTFSAIANDAGDIVNSEFVVDAQHIGVRFMLTARGAASQAQTTFTDGNLQSDITFNIGPATVNVGDALSWTATASCLDQNQNNTCAGNGFILGGPVADTYSLDVQQSTTASFTPGTTTSRQVSGTVGGTSAGGFTAPATGGTYFYRVRHFGQTIGSNTWQPQNSAVVTITVDSCTAPAVTTQPTSQSITYGQNASFQAAASGTPTPTMQWQVSTDNGANWNNLAGATSTTLALTQPTVAMSGNQYRAVFTNTCNGTQTVTTSAATLTVAKATAAVTLSNLTQTYTGSPLTPTATTNPAGLNITWTGAPQTNAGSYPVTAIVNDANYQGSATPGTFVVNTASSTTAVTCGAGPFSYSGAAITACSAAVTGVGGLNQSLTVTYSNNVNAGVASAGASFAGDANHDPSSDSKTFTINQAPAVTTITCPTNVTYTGLPLAPCSATATGAGGLNESVAVTYANNINAGTATADATFAGDENHNGSTATQATFTIDKAPSTTTTVGDGPFTYDGTTHAGGSGTVTGAGGLSTSATSLTYTGDQINAGTYYVTAHYAGDANHDASDGAAVAIVINKAGSTATVSCPAGPFTYTGSAQTPCTASYSTTDGLGGSLAVNYTDNLNAGTATASASYGGDPNHESSSDSQTFTIDKAGSTTTTVGDGPFTYDNTTHAGGSGTVTGAGGLSTSATSVTYTGDRVNAGTYHVTAHYAGDANHEASDGAAVVIVINKAPSTTTTVGDGPFTYDNTTHAGGSGTVTGAGALSTSATSVTYTGDQINAGTYYVTAHYAGDANHDASDGAAVAIVINKATSTTTIACPSNVTYTGLALTPCTATVAGVGGLNQPVNVTYLNNTNPGTGTANASYSGDANHQVSSDTKTFAITYGLCSAAVGAGGVILQPINSDGTSVFARKGGSTLPVKFRVCDASGNPISDPAAVFAGTGGSLTMLSAVRGTVDVVNEPGVMEIPDAAFRFSGNQWVFNMATSNLAQGTTYTFRINLASGSILFRAGIK
jgi:hypothetical protein